MAGALRGVLLEHRLLSGRPASDALVVASNRGTPVETKTITRRARRAWCAYPHLTPIGLHEARHVYASLMIAAGVGFKELSTYMGHSSITVTIDRYGHLLPGSCGADAARLDALLVDSVQS